METSWVPASKQEENVLTDHSIQIFAHRGAKDRANEATIAAYDLAAQDGVDALEIDLRMTKDGVLVAMHDQTIDRTTNGEGKVETYTLEELTSFQTIGYYNEEETREPIPTLEEILERYGKDETYYIETRLVAGELAMEEELIALLEQHDLMKDNRVMLQSFSEESLKKLNDLVPEVPLTQLFRRGEFDLNKALASPYPAIGIESGDLLKKDVEALQLVEKEVHVYFTDYKTEQEEQKRVVKYGIDGLFTDQIQFTSSLVDEQ